MKKYTKPKINTIAFTQMNENSVDKARVLTLKDSTPIEFSNLNN